MYIMHRQGVYDCYRTALDQVEASSSWARVSDLAVSVTMLTAARCSQLSYGRVYNT